MARKSLGYVKLEWTCPNCGTKNPGPQQTCTACGAAQPDDIQFEQSSQAEVVKDEKEIERAQRGPDIHCPYCNARNPGGSETCVQCGGDLREGVRRESGRVIGAYKTVKEPVKEIPCPNCQALNPETNGTCSACGASLTARGAPQKAAAGVEIPASSEAKEKKRNPCITIAIVGVVLIAIIACVAILYLTVFKKENTSATVQDIYWERIIEIEELGPVEKEGWLEDIPSDAEIGFCEQELHHTQSNDAIGAVEVCGTPYTVDSGTGMGEVVQDCEYEIYQDYCEYTVQEWITVDEVKQAGRDLDASWPDPMLMDGQRSGDETESYTITFQTVDEIYTYTTSDYGLFRQCQIGSPWTLTVNGLGNVVEIEPGG